MSISRKKIWNKSSKGWNRQTDSKDTWGREKTQRKKGKIDSWGRKTLQSGTTDGKCPRKKKFIVQG